MAKNSKIKALLTLVESFCTINILICDPSTGKSAAMNVIKNSILSIDEYLGVDFEKNQICNAGTVEGLVNTMKQFGNNQINIQISYLSHKLLLQFL
jgi:hypothetical protein